MIIEGTIKGRVVVLDAGASLPEGARVRVEPIRPPAKSHFRSVGTWDGPPGELDQLLTEVQTLRNAELTEGGDDEVSA